MRKTSSPGLRPLILVLVAGADKTTYYHRKKADNFGFKQLYCSIVFKCTWIEELRGGRMEELLMLTRWF